MDEITMPEGTHLEYTVYAETYWWQQLSRETRPNGGRPCVQMAAGANEGGGVKWEFGVVEHDLGRAPALKLSIYDEGWEAFTCMAPFFAALASGEVRTLADVRNLLDSLGAVDKTERAMAGVED